MLRAFATVACLLAIPASLFADEAADAVARRAVIGKWIEHHSEGRVVDQTFNEDGSYLSLMKPRPDQEVRILFEGTWRIADGKFHFDLSPPDPRVQMAKLSYTEKILSLTEDELRYEPSDKPGAEEVLKRVRKKPWRLLASDLAGAWRTDYDWGNFKVHREMTFDPFLGRYFEDGRLRITKDGEEREVPYVVTGEWRVRDNVFIVKIDKTSIEPLYPEKTTLWAEVESIEGGVLKMKPFNGGGLVTATWYDRDALLPSETDDATLTARAAGDHLFGVPVVGSLPAPEQKRIHERILPKASTSVLVGMLGLEALKQNPGLDQGGARRGNNREHNAGLSNSTLFSRWGITTNFGRVREIDFSGPGTGATAGDVELSFQWLEATLGNATKCFAYDLEPTQEGYESIGAYWAKPEALIVLSFGAKGDQFFPHLEIHPASRDLEMVRSAKDIVYGEGTPSGRKALHGDWARKVAKLPE